MQSPPYAKPAWFLGLDLGQRRDHSALATLEIFWTYSGRDAVTFEHVWAPAVNLCGLRRFPLGLSYTEYPKIVHQRIQRVHRARGVAPFAPADVTLVVDAGGPGGPVVDELRRAHLDATIAPILITGGASPGHAANGFKTVPRRELISNLVLFLDHQVLRWPDTLPEREPLEEELLNLSVRTTHPDDGGAHDDLVMATAIALWQAKCHSPQILPKSSEDTGRRWTPHGRLFW